MENELSKQEDFSVPIAILKDAIKHSHAECDKAFELFKAIAPSLWEKYNNFPAPEFEEAVRNAAQFCVLASVGFNHHAQHRDIVMGVLEGQVFEKLKKSVKI
ncbi:MAG: hypothetical protein F6K40_12465 [Okeania sp. SIO3I5]|uniref:hypothetical protein n=1 Tax=Okeania sp. SIO3I5 TaxID=2607805 RepID=UPI0013BA1062|nr:hypothetical protein [Okeania sp. SIO3I5]NEQ37043.1 hypothetical protein [Okeania sp. SIO3I5]